MEMAMTLIRAHGNKRILHPTHHDTWWLITAGPRKLTSPEFNAVHNGIVALMIGTHDRVTVPGWKAQKNWTGLPWQVLFDKTANKDDRLAAWMMGSMAQYAFIHHHLTWYTDQTVYVGRDVPNTYYFLKGAFAND
jgi:hypothetical protein